ncbi:LAME_0G11672g1_1 [Lachancea meyersii CBS 8951]|uniref:LAME_0G11672g1_1 n=1 Tax=Lachancea meyersii CBS 8951 TaxID=1266667 RepID=A0A1G4K9C1_9SACH|nr:LAME_0G11672g1_1 [Lachancea meyersii CBS 8951]
MAIDKRLIVGQLHQELRYIQLIYHRNKNQHKVAVWWKHFNELKRSVGQVLVLIQNDKVRKVEVIRLRNLIQKLRKRQISRMYYSFNGVVGLGQFVTLGVVLVGLLAKIKALYDAIYELYEAEFKTFGLLEKQTVSDPSHISSEQIGTLNGEEIGEEINIDEQPTQKPDMAAENFAAVYGSRKKDKKKVKKKKKKGSAMDDIFG